MADPDAISRPCGCPLDYHLSDCPILTSRREVGEEVDRYFDDYYGDY